MTIRRVQIERLSVTSFKPFEVVVAALKRPLGIRIATDHLDGNICVL